MYQHADPLYLICETPLHAGSGSDLGIVDMPIQRERHTGFPKVESSGLKGCLREAFERGADEATLIKIHAAFGYDADDMTKETKETVEKAFTDNETKETQFAGCLGFSDARLLLFPVKSMRGIFAWVTCPAVLNRYFQDFPSLRQAQETDIRLDKDTAKVPHNCDLFIGKDKKKLILEEYSFDAVKDDKNGVITQFADTLAKLLFQGDEYRQDKLKTALVVLPDDAFSDFVTLSTEVITRTKINNETGTVKDGALFTEEFLPAESVLYSLVLSGPLFMKDKLLQAQKSHFADFLENDKPHADKTRALFKAFWEKTSLFQLGGNAGLGKGIVKAVFKEKQA